MKFTATLIALTLAASVAIAADSTKTEAKKAPAKADTTTVEPAKTETAKGATKVDTVTTKSGLVVIDHKVGTGAEAGAHSVVKVDYTVWLYEDGRRTKQIQSSVGGEKLVATLGNGTLIAGWNEGIVGMKVGGVRELIVPPALGWGSRGAGSDIPPNATTNFVVELFEIVK